LIELLAAIGVAAIALVILASAVKSQGTNAVFQMGAADMQQNVRGALEDVPARGAHGRLRHVRGAVRDAADLRVPAVGAASSTASNLFGNFGFVKSRVNADRGQRRHGA
jgi:hypothetical protein